MFIQTYEVQVADKTFKSTGITEEEANYIKRILQQDNNGIIIPILAVCWQDDFKGPGSITINRIRLLIDHRKFFAVAGLVNTFGICLSLMKQT